MRLFIAINFDENIKDTLIELQSDLMQSGISGNFTRLENLHMTLAFIGEYDDPKAVLDVMKKVPLRSFTISIKDYRPFKDMYFADISESQELHSYVKRLRAALLDNEIPFDRKKFLPHVTLVRNSKRSEILPMPVFSESDSMRVRGISLMKSERAKHGMKYTEIGYVTAL